MRQSRGLALLIVVGVLGLLAVLATAFVTMAQLERRASRQRLYATKALLLARSGIEDALARLSAGQDPQLAANRYGGENWDGLAGDTLTAFEAAQEVYRPTGAGSRADVDACPVRHAMRPSFFTRLSPGSPDPDLVGVEGRRRGYSGRLARDLAEGSNAYALKVKSGGLYVNGGDPAAAPAEGYNAVLRRILGTLGKALDREDGTNDGLPVGKPDGERLIDRRPAGGWKSFEQIRDLALGGSQGKLDTLEPYLLLTAWVDRKVIRPNIDPDWTVPDAGYANAQTAMALAEVRVGQRDTPVDYSLADPPTGVGALWAGKRAFNPHTDSYAPDFERDGSGRVSGRAPVDLNWARDKPAVLKALLTGLAGIHLDSDYMRFQNQASGVGLQEDQGSLGIFYRAALDTPIPLVNGIVAAFGAHTGFPTWVTEYPDWDRTPSFDSWDEFDRFVEIKLGGLPQAKRDLIKANFNPNSNLNKFNPGETRFKAIDKSDLTAYSTEFCFRSPNHVLSATGRVTGPGGRVLAERTLSAEVAFAQLCLTTQSEFCAGDLGRLDVAGDEASFRLPGDGDFLEQTGGENRTFGSRYPPIPPAGDTRGLCLQTYPEPQWRGAPCPAPAAYDGSLQLATLESGAPPTADTGMTFLASFDNGYDATWAAGTATCSLDSCQGSGATSLLGSGPVGSRAVLNMLHPDGCYSESRRVPGYLARDNMGDGLQGILSFWYKPSFGHDPPSRWSSITDRKRHITLVNLVSLGADPLVNPFAVAYAQTQMFRVGGKRYDGLGWEWGALTENRYSAGDTGVEQATFFKWLSGGKKTFIHAHRWLLVTYQWNLQGATNADFGFFMLNGTSHLLQGTPWYYEGPDDGGGQSLTRDCYREDGSVGSPFFHLGSRGWTYNNLGAADGTIDEFAFFTRSTSMTDSSLLAAGQFPAGRYHKEDGALDPGRPQYRSCSIPLGAGARILRVDWTFVLPRVFPTPPPAPPDLWPVPNQAYHGTGVSATAGDTADAAISLMDAMGTPSVPERLTRSGSAVSVGLPDGLLKVGVDLRPRLGDNQAPWGKLDAPLLESPVLDDITVTYTGPLGPRITAWGAP